MRQKQSRPDRRAPTIAGCRPARARQNDLELDRAFLDWLESRLADGGLEAPQEHMLDYLVAWAMRSDGTLAPVDA
jgi:hypothetical protein